MDIRELVTLFTFKTDEAGLKSQETKLKSAISGIKSTLSTFGTVFGAQLAFDTARSVITGLADGIKEANRIKTQIGQILTPDMDLDTTMKQLFDFAQEVGSDATEVAQHFRSMAIAADSVGVSQENALEATKNVAKAIDISRLSGEQAAAAFDKINMSLRRGQLSGRSFGEILDTAPKVIEALGQNLNRTIPELRKMADAGELTTEVLINGFTKTNVMIEKMMAEKPTSLSDAFTYVNNVIIRVGQSIWKLTTGVSYIARQIIYFTQVIVRWGEAFVKAVGGAENAMRLIGLAIEVALGLKTLQIVLTMSAALNKLGATALITAAKFALILASIVAIALAIDDLIAWSQGRDSLTGRLIGPIALWQKQVDLITAPIKAIKQIFTGDFGGGFTTLWNAFATTTTKLDALALLIGTIPVAFGLWKAISFTTTLVKVLIDLATKTKLVRAAVWAVNNAYQLWNGIKFLGLIAQMALVAIKTFAVRVAVLAVQAAYWLWNTVIAFGGLLANLASVILRTEAVTAAAGATKAAFIAMDALTFAGVTAALTPLLAALTPILAAIAVIYAFKPTTVASGTVTDAHKKAVLEANAKGEPPPTMEGTMQYLGGDPQAEYDRIIAEQARKKAEGPKGLNKYIPDWMRWDTSPEAMPPSATPVEASTWDKIAEFFKMPLDKPPIPTLPPGAIGPAAAVPSGPVDNSVTAPITNNITITAPVELDANRLAAAVDQRVGAAMTTVVNETARKLSNATPVTEARTGAAP